MNGMTNRIAMWSGPRNLSTAMMYAFAARGDCAVWDEPFYAAYLAATGIDHPMRDAVIGAGLTDPAQVASACLGRIPQEQTLFYQKHMTLHMIPEIDRGFMRSLTNVFLIRHPARVVGSYAKKREGPKLTDIGFVQQAELFDEAADWLGHAPLVIDSADICSDPARMLGKLCDGLGIAYTDRMLHWPEGPKPYDGVWASHWYGAVHRSTGFEAAESAMPDLPAEYQRLADQALSHYEKLYAHRLGGQ
jgi:hypothetical protein